jgi:hypothetical protein
MMSKVVNAMDGWDYCNGRNKQLLHECECCDYPKVLEPATITAQSAAWATPRSANSTITAMNFIAAIDEMIL